MIDSLSCFSARRLPTGQRILPSPKLAILLALLALLLLSACATGNKTTIGMRPEFQRVEIDSIAIVPFYAQSRFSLNDADFEAMIESYESATAAWFERMGFDVVDARAFQHHLTEIGAWQEFNDGIILRHSLRNYFEHTGTKPSLAIEVITLKRLAAEGKLPAQNLLFGEVIYHSEGICHIDARGYSDYVETSVLSQAPSSLPRPCIVSHFQAKLITASSAQTMWFNRSMREVHTGSLEPQMTAQTVSETIEQTFGNKAGIKIQPGPNDSSTAISDRRLQPIQPD